MKIHQLYYLVLFAFLITTLPSFAQNLKYSRIKIYTDARGLTHLAEQGVSIDHGEVKENTYFISEFSENDVVIIQKSGIKYDVLIDDVSEYYATQNDLPENRVEYSGTLPCKPGPAKSFSHFHLGKYAGFFGYDEVLEILDSMQLIYPNLITKRTPIDGTTTWQGRPVYWFRISNNPNTEQPNKPQVFYNALHHAREAGSLSQIIYYMWYLLDNYATDKEVKGLVDNLELYFVPLVNPDGYVANQKSNPNGGGMQRKNGHGVDLNRNYDMNWSYDNVGSSNSSGSDSYRGPSAGSEPETKMIKKFCIDHKFKLAMSCHTFGGYLIHPWTYKANSFTPDNKTIVAYGKYMAQKNKYKVGTPNQTVGYTANGSTGDWFYGEQKLKDKIFEYSPEAGSSFYPPKNQILAFCKEVWEINYKMAKLALKYVLAEDTQPYYVKNKTGYFTYQYKTLVPDTMAHFTIKIIPISPEILTIGNAKKYDNTPNDVAVNDSISYILDPSIKIGTELKYVLNISNGQFTHSDTVIKMYGNPTVVIAESGNDINNWISSSWNLSSTVFHSPSSSITDSPTGKYENNASTTISSKNGIDLSNASSALLTFWAKWEIEAGFDYTQILASADSGQTWTPLCGKYSSLGSKNQDLNQPVYDGEIDWVEEEINLQDYLGKKVWFRFALKTDGKNTFDGFYFDDFKVSKLDATSNGIEKFKEINSFQISNPMPNPANDYVYINYQIANPVHTAISLIINNMVGQTVYSKEIEYNSSGNVMINTSNLPNGIYTYRLQNNMIKSAAKRMCIVH